MLETGEFIKTGDTKNKQGERSHHCCHQQKLTGSGKRNLREDLLPVERFAIELPPLRERKEDMQMLAEYYTRLFAAKRIEKLQALAKKR